MGSEIRVQESFSGILIAVLVHSIHLHREDQPFLSTWLILLGSKCHLWACLCVRICKVSPQIGTCGCCLAVSPLTEGLFSLPFLWEESDEALKWRVPQTHKQAVNEQPRWGAQCFCSIGWLFSWVGGMLKSLQGYGGCEGFWCRLIYSRLCTQGTRAAAFLFSCCLGFVVW